MPLKGSIPIDSHYEQVQKTKWTFFRKVQLSLTSAIIVSFLCIGSIIFFRQYTDVKHQLESQGEVLTLNLAHNAEPFIVDYDKDQLNQFLDAMLSNPLVLFSGIINTRYTDPNIDVLKKQGAVDLNFVTEVVRRPNYAQIKGAMSMDVKNIEHKIKNVVFCISPIFSDFKFPDDETTLLYNQPKHKGIIGYSVMAYRMPWEQLFSVQIQWVAAAFILLSIILGTILGKLIAHQFTRRIRGIYDAIERYSFGDVLSLNDQGTDEISDISNSIQGLTELVSVQLNKIEHINKTLEMTVSDRVSDIQRLKNRLDLFNNNQRAFVGQTAQEIKSLIQMVPLLNDDTKKNIQQHLNLLMDRMLQMIKHNKEFLDSGLIESIHIDDLMTELRPIFDALSKKNNNQVEYAIQEGVVITSDKVQLKQALIQLMHNASKYTENGQIKWSVSADQNNTFFKISDSGIGMDQEKVNDVLTQLDQNDMRLIDAFSTLGLGLVLIHRFCRNVQAKLICLSEPNRGTTIEIIHPLSVSLDAKKHMFVCVSKHQDNALKIKQEVQSVSGWDCMALSDAGLLEYSALAAIIIDLTFFEYAIETLAAIKQKMPHIDVICWVDDQFIRVRGLVPFNLKKMMTTIDQLFPKKSERSCIYVTGFTDEVNQKLVAQSGEAITTTYDYRQAIQLKITTEKGFEMSIRSTPILLVYESQQSLMALIKEKGWPMERLLKLKGSF